MLYISEYIKLPLVFIFAEKRCCRAALPLKCEDYLSLESLPYLIRKWVSILLYWISFLKYLVKYLLILVLLSVSIYELLNNIVTKY